MDTAEFPSEELYAVVMQMTEAIVRYRAGGNLVEGEVD